MNLLKDEEYLFIYAWNEWVEGAYLLPDVKYGFEYLNAVKDVIVDKKYEKYKK